MDGAPPSADEPLPTDGPLPIGRAAGAHVRRYRRERALSQRALARDLGWTQSTLSRAETDASSMRLDRVETLLRRTGARLAIVRAVTPPD